MSSAWDIEEWECSVGGYSDRNHIRGFIIFLKSFEMTHREKGI